MRVGYRPWQDQGRTRVITRAEELAAELDLMKRRMKGHDTYALTAEDLTLLIRTVPGFNQDGAWLRPIYARLRALGLPPSELESITFPAVLAELRGTESPEQKRGGRPPTGRAQHDRFAAIVKEAAGRRLTYEDVRRVDPELPKDLSKVKGRAAEAYPQLRQDFDGEGVSWFWWDPLTE